MNNTNNQIEHFVADFDEDLEVTVDKIEEKYEASSFWKDAWKRLKHNPLFFISAFLAVFFLFLMFFPAVFTQIDPRACIISQSKIPVGTKGHILGTTLQGCDVFSRLVYGAQPSLMIGVITTLVSAVTGVLIGSIAGFFGGWVDAILSRILEIFLSIPSMCAFIVVLQLLRNLSGIQKLVIMFSIFGWMTIARIMRGNVLSVKGQEFTTSAIALGASKLKIMFSHIIPNAIGPVVATATMQIGVWIIVESALSYLGLGLSSSNASWGIDIANASSGSVWLNAPSMLFAPCIVLVIASLTFILLGDSIQDAIDPKGKR
jgi:oligopeptide transport system permease protein